MTDEELSKVARAIRLDLNDALGDNDAPQLLRPDVDDLIRYRLKEFAAAERERQAVWHDEQARHWKKYEAEAAARGDRLYAAGYAFRAGEHEMSAAALREGGA